MDLKGKKIGFALTGSFCTLSKVIPQMEYLAEIGADIIPIVSSIVKNTDTRFGKASDFIETMETISGKKVIDSIYAAEPIGPKDLLDALIIAPCTGNTLSKMANGITDTSVTMAAKATIRNQHPVVIAVSTNDGLGASAKNIGVLQNAKYLYFVPYWQDDSLHKPNSLVADMNKIIPTLMQAMEFRQIQPLLLEK